MNLLIVHKKSFQQGIIKHSFGHQKRAASPDTSSHDPPEQNTALLSQTYSNANIDMAFSTSCSIASTAALAKSWKYLTSFSSSSFFTAFTPALDI